MDHEAIGELHGLGTLSAELTRHNNLATLGTSLHDKAENTIAGTADSQATQELVAQALALCNGAKTTGGDLVSVQL